MVMKIYSSGTMQFSNNGLGNIKPLKCIETKKKSLNGWEINCEVELKYQDIIINDNIVLIETKEKGKQPFVIDDVSIKKTISFIAKHVVFLSQRYLLADVRPTNLICNDFINYINQRTDTESPFTVSSNVAERRTKYFIRKNLLEAFENTEELFDAVFDVDGYHVSLNTSVSNISDTTLIYGKNIEGIKIYENWKDVCTKILPVGPDELMLPELYIISDVQYDLPYTKTVTFSIEKENEDGKTKTEVEMIDELRSLANRYLKDNKYPKINCTVTANVEQNLNIGDIVPVKHPLTTFETEVQSYEYNVLTKRVTSIEYGNYERDIKKTFASINSQIKDVDKKAENFLSDARKEVEYLMNIAGKNGSVIFRKNEDGVIYEILCIDTKDIETAKTIMKINNQGIAGTTGGINGEFNSAIMANGTVLADAIKTGTLSAIDIEGVYIYGSYIYGASISGGNIDVSSDVHIGNELYIGNQSIGSGKGISFSGNCKIQTYSNWLQFIANSNGTEAWSGVQMIKHSGNGDDSISVSKELIFLASISNSGRNNVHVETNKFTSNVPLISSSDRKLKTDINDIDLSSLLDDFNLKSFINRDSKKEDVGVIAQDYENNNLRHFVLSLVDRTVGTNKKGNRITKKYYGVKYNALFLAATQEVCKLRKEMSEKDKTIKKLEDRLTKIEKILFSEVDNENR